MRGWKQAYDEYCAGLLTENSVETLPSSMVFKAAWEMAAVEWANTDGGRFYPVKNNDP